MNNTGRRADDGFTLVELLVSVTILGFITAALGTALFVGIKTTADNQTGISQSNGEQLVAHVLSKDVHSACSTTAGGPTGCGTLNPTTTASATCSASGSFTVKTVTDVLATASDATITYSLSAGTLTRAVTGPVPSTRAVIDNVACFAAVYAATGKCAGQFQVDVTQAGSSKGNGTSPYSFSVCAHRRAQ